MPLYNTLRKSRILVAVLVLTAIVVLFADLYEWIPTQTYDTILYFQFVPALLTFLKTFTLISAGGFVAVLLLTLLTGRLYCSTICPLGILQDVVSRIAKWRSHKKHFFKYKKDKPIWRYTFLCIMALGIIMGAGWMVSWLDPYSLAGRFFSYLIKPIVILLNNAGARLINHLDWYFLSYHNLLVASIIPALVTLIVITFIFYFAWKRGRLFCNTICPVGTLLGFVSRFSLYKIHFNRDACTRCGKCAGVCKSECIDIKSYRVDDSRCVTCFNCLSICPESALSLSRDTAINMRKRPTPSKKKEAENSRRQFIFTGLTLLAGTQLASAVKSEENTHGKHLLRNKKEHPVCPPGSISQTHFNDTCTACGLCVSACPTQVLQPALTQYGMIGFMQPHLDYQTSFCNFDCHKCSEVCPTGAILPLTKEKKQVTQMGKAIFVKQNCVVFTDETDCGACSEHCPTKAVHMVPYKDGLVIPEVDQSICIGCGACEHPCPVNAPFKAIYVNGNPIQQIAEKPKTQKKKIIDNTEDFPF